jgi:hypothetical protein
VSRLRFIVALLLLPACTREPRGDGFDFSTTGGTGTGDTTDTSTSTSTGVAESSSSSSDGSGSTGGSEGSSSSSTGEPSHCGDGTIDPGDVCFRPETTVLAMGAGVRDISVADFDVDGDLDLVTLDADTPAAYLRRGDGAGGFADPETWPVTPGAFRLAHGDFDYDGDPDFVVFGQNLTVFFNATGTFTSDDMTSAGILVDELTDGVVGEFDDQLGLDVVHTTQESGYFQRGAVAMTGWEFGQSFGVPVPSDGTSGLAATVFAFDDDAIEDLVVLDRDLRDARLLRANGGGGFQVVGDVTVCPLGSGAYRAAVGDVNGDGEADLVVTCTIGVWTLLHGEGDGQFGDPIEYIWDTAFRPAITDIDHDGDDDVLVSAAGLGQVGVFASERSGLVIFDSKVQVGGSVWAFAVGDLDDDGALDLAVGVTGEGEGNVEIFWADP